MEFKIMNVNENLIAQEIHWNNEELKKEISLKMADYESLVFTEDTIDEAKKDRATLNKLKTSFEDERKRIKKIYLDPYNKFEAQVKEVISLIEKPIGLIDQQIKEVEENKKLQKREDIEEIFKQTGFQSFVALEKIFDQKWLNASVSLKRIQEQMQNMKYSIGEDVYAIHQLPNFSFEAMEVYKETLSLTDAINEGQRLADIQKRKTAAEEAKRRVAEEVLAATTNKIEDEVESAEEKVIPEEVYTLDFRVIATREQLALLKTFLKQNNITYGPVPVTTKGE